MDMADILQMQLSLTVHNPRSLHAQGVNGISDVFKISLFLPWGLEGRGIKQTIECLPCLSSMT